MNLSDYKKYISAETMMGPNSARILQELLEKFPLQLNENDTVLDLGCGKGLTSLIIAKETEAKVFADDLWISAEDNAARFAGWGVGDRITPVHADANELPFEKKQFAALFSVDSYHYFATDPGFFEEKILPFLADGATVLIGIPGVKNAYSGRSEELLSEWLGDEAYMFQSPDRWKEIIGANERIASVETWEMDCFDDAWEQWFASGHEYALGDKNFFDRLIKPYTCFAGICVRLK